MLLEKTSTRGVAAELARRCAKHPAVVTSWRKGAKPETASRRVIEEYLGIEIDLFDATPSEEFFVEPESDEGNQEKEASTGPEAA